MRAAQARSRRAVHLLRAALAAAVLAAAAPAQAAFDGCLSVFPQRHVPQLPRDSVHRTRPLCFDGFAVLHSATSKTPVYAVERLNRQDFEDARKRQRGRNPFYEEARLPRAERATLDDYRATLPDGRRMDRGHVVPAGDMTRAAGFAQSFSLANMVPQVPAANQGPWNRIEQDTRRYVQRARGDVYVITGPVFGPRPLRLGPGQVWVPEAMFKLVYDAASNRAWAHWLPNSAGARVERPITYETLTRRIGMQLLRTAPDD
ncbi:DNA/RNA non-specific endonuclease [Pseudorhodoferax sp.]|uniref:DNA/RNA non-specific endonuclease n=1 Tax=Pseudorhodoferax sp. TaxID=1993553 RepID=UPI002DD6A273|nr:DNA/RNA non-specific endonuclease [Pseudorhodoferax sp.]